jgi:hypothetical protein
MSLNLAEKIKNFLYSIWFLWSLAILLNIITFLFLYFKIHPGNKTVALNFNILVGVRSYGKGINLYAIPGAGLAIMLVNGMLYRSIRYSEDYLPFMPAFISICSQLVLLTAAISLAKVN